jgi:hypothetical protein
VTPSEIVLTVAALAMLPWWLRLVRSGALRVQPDDDLAGVSEHERKMKALQR